MSASIRARRRGTQIGYQTANPRPPATASGPSQVCSGLSKTRKTPIAADSPSRARSSPGPPLLLPDDPGQFGHPLVTGRVLRQASGGHGLVDVGDCGRSRRFPPLPGPDPAAQPDEDRPPGTRIRPRSPRPPVKSPARGANACPASERATGRRSQGK